MPKPCSPASPKTDGHAEFRVPADRCAGDAALPTCAREGGSCGPNFQLALQRVVEEHDRELEALRLENARLHSQLNSGEAAGTCQSPAGFSVCCHNGHLVDADCRRVSGVLVDVMQLTQTALKLVSSAPMEDVGAECGTANSADALLQKPSTACCKAAAEAPPKKESTCTVNTVLREEAPSDIHTELSTMFQKEADHNVDATAESLRDQQQRSYSCPLIQQSFTLRPRWAPMRHSYDSDKDSLNLANCDQVLLRDDGEEVDSAAEEQVVGGTGRLRRFIAFPGSPYRLVWDLCGMFLIGYDIITIPLMVFSSQQQMFFVVMGWAAQMFWTCDMFASLCVGYVHKGQTIMDPRRILLNYLKTWFVIDCCVVVPDWLRTILDAMGSNAEGNSSSAGGIGRLVKVLRIMRILRLLRLAKLRRIVKELYDRIESEYASVIIKIVKLMMILLIINHFIACLWFAIGDLGGGADGGNNWVKVYVPSSGWDYQYFTSLHWSLTQFTPASMHVQPQNTGERTFAIVILVIALLSFSSLLGSITSSMTQLQNMQDDAWMQFWLLRRYMKQRGVPQTLAFRVERYLEFKNQSQKQQVPCTQVKILSLLSEQLHDELECAIVLPIIVVHPIFERVNEMSSVTMNRLSRQGMSIKSLARHDSLFFPGDAASHMSFIVHGPVQEPLTYVKAKMKKGEVEATPIPVSMEDWICEPILWTEWYHIGELQATTECDLIQIEALKFETVIAANPVLWGDVSKYAQKWVMWINMEPPEELSDISSKADGKNRASDFLQPSKIMKDGVYRATFMRRFSRGSK